MAGRKRKYPNKVTAVGGCHEKTAAQERLLFRSRILPKEKAVLQPSRYVTTALLKATTSHFLKSEKNTKTHSKTYHDRTLHFALVK